MLLVVGQQRLWTLGDFMARALCLVLQLDVVADFVVGRRKFDGACTDRDLVSVHYWCKWLELGLRSCRCSTQDEVHVVVLA